MLRGHFNCFADGDTKAAWRIRMFSEDTPAGICFSARARHAFGTPSLHQRLAVRLLLETDFDHIDAHIEAEYNACKGERRAPLAGTGLGGEPRDTGLLVVKGLGHRGVGFVTSGGAHPFVFVIDLGGGIERPLQPARPIERRRSPLTVDFADRLGDFDRALGRYLLLDQRHWKQRFEILWSDGLQGPRMKHGLGRTRQIGDDVVPILWEPGLFEQIFHRVGHALFPVQPLAGGFQMPRSCISRTWRSITWRLYSAWRPGILSIYRFL